MRKFAGKRKLELYTVLTQYTFKYGGRNCCRYRSSLALAFYSESVGRKTYKK